MKRIISLLLLAILAVSMAACAGGETPADTNSSYDTTVEEETMADTADVPETDVQAKPDPIVSEVEKRVILERDTDKLVFTDSNGFELPYRIYVPADYSEEYAYPLVVFLHGSGERGNDNSYQLSLVVMHPFMDKKCPIYQSIVIVPQCPDDYRWVDNDGEAGSYNIDDIPIAEPMSALVELMDSVIEEYSINEDRQYVFGLSMGGYGTWDLLMRFPDRFAAAVPLCGGGDPSKAADLVDIPIHVFHDVDDDSVPVSGSQNMVNAIRAAGGEKIIYTETTGNGHEVWEIAIHEGDLSVIYWMFEQRRE